MPKRQGLIDFAALGMIRSGKPAFTTPADPNNKAPASPFLKNDLLESPMILNKYVDCLYHTNVLFYQIT